MVKLRLTRLGARAAVLLGGLACFALLPTAAQADLETRTPASCANNTSLGTVNWTNPGNAVVDDANYATAGVAGGGTTTRYLLCTNYGFSLPAGARINGIIVNVERRSSSAAAGGTEDAAMRIVKGGTIGTADRATTTVYTTSDVSEPHGDATDLWGLTWTAADINATNFGAAFASMKNTPGGGTHTISVNVVSITVDYTPPPTVVSIVRASANPTSAATVDWTVTFSESVSAVDASDFALAVSGLSGSSIASVSGGPILYTVTANSGTGTGTLGLNVVDDDSIVNAAGVALAGTGTVDGAFTGQVYTVNRPSVSSFNVVEPTAHPTAGRIYTKIAGQNIAVDIVALDASNNVSTGFTGDVAVELVDNTSGGACSGLPLIKTLANQTFGVGDSGRHPLSAGQFEANAYRNVKFRIRYPVASPTITACSGDAFANRPSGIMVTSSDATNTGTSGTPAIKAGASFNLTAASGVNGYNGTPTIDNSLVVGSPSAGVISGSFGAANPSGTASGDSFSYSEVGLFGLGANAVRDTSFTAVDQPNDCTADFSNTLVSGRYGCYFGSGAIAATPGSSGFGRFIPDHFALTASSLTPRTDIAACSGSTFTYLGERMDLNMTLQARNASGAATTNYSGSWAKFDLSTGTYNFGAIDAGAPTLLTSRISTLPSTVVSSWTSGSAQVIVPASVARNASPDGPYNSVRLGVAPVDPDNVTIGSFNLDADNNGSNERAQIGGGTRLRFGHLRMENAVGSEKIPLPIQMETQYWNGATFARNADDDCTTVARPNFALGSYTGNLIACETIISAATVVFTDGIATVNLAAPCTGTPCSGNDGSVLLTLNLATPSGNRCDAVGGPGPAATSAGMSYLLGRWNDAADPDGNPATVYDDNPSSRAAFGLYGGQPNNFIYFRENY